MSRPILLCSRQKVKRERLAADRVGGRLGKIARTSFGSCGACSGILGCYRHAGPPHLGSVNIRRVIWVERDPRPYVGAAVSMKGKTVRRRRSLIPTASTAIICGKAGCPGPHGGRHAESFGGLALGRVQRRTITAGNDRTRPVVVQRSCVRHVTAFSHTRSRSSSKTSFASAGVVNQTRCASSPSSCPGPHPA